MEKTNGKRYITATEAHAMSEASIAQKNHLYKAISETAKEGYNELPWCVAQMSESSIERLKKDLISDGFLIETEKDEGKEVTLIVRW